MPLSWPPGHQICLEDRHGPGHQQLVLQNWMHQADVDKNGSGDCPSGSEKKDLAELRRRNRQLERENDILNRAAAYFARENAPPK